LGGRGACLKGDNEGWGVGLVGCVARSWSGMGTAIIGLHGKPALKKGGEITADQKVRI